ncbi:MAG: hypothetical protein Q3962_06660 [Corynebacterium sp.]|nr:hypothetical protein [Corynebacterium sp.]
MNTLIRCGIAVLSAIALCSSVIHAPTAHAFGKVYVPNEARVQSAATHPNGGTREYPTVSAAMFLIRDAVWCKNDAGMPTRVVNLENASHPSVKDKVVSNQPIQVGDCLITRVDFVNPKREVYNTHIENANSSRPRTIPAGWNPVGMTVGQRGSQTTTADLTTSAFKFVWDGIAFDGWKFHLFFLWNVTADNIAEASKGFSANLPWANNRPHSQLNVIDYRPYNDAVALPGGGQTYYYTQPRTPQPTVPVYTEALTELNGLIQDSSNALSAAQREALKTSRDGVLNEQGSSDEQKKTKLEGLSSDTTALLGALGRATAAITEANNDLKDAELSNPQSFADAKSALASAMAAAQATAGSVDEAIASFKATVGTLKAENNLRKKIRGLAATADGTSTKLDGLSTAQVDWYLGKVNDAIANNQAQALGIEAELLSDKVKEIAEVIATVTSELSADMSKETTELTSKAQTAGRSIDALDQDITNYYDAAEAKGYAMSKSTVDHAKMKVTLLLEDEKSVLNKEQKAAFEKELEALGTKHSADSTMTMTAKRADYDALATKIQKLAAAIQAINETVRSASRELGREFESIAADTKAVQAAAAASDATEDGLKTALENYKKRVDEALKVKQQKDDEEANRLERERERESRERLMREQILTSARDRAVRTMKEREGRLYREQVSHPRVVAARQKLEATANATDATADSIDAGITLYTSTMDELEKYLKALEEAKEAAAKKDSSTTETPNLDGLSPGQIENFEKLIDGIANDTSLSDEEKLTQLKGLRDRIDDLIAQIKRAQKARKETADKAANLTDSEKLAALAALDKELSDAASATDADAASVKNAVDDYLLKVQNFLGQDDLDTEKEEELTPSDKDPAPQEPGTTPSGSSIQWWHILLILLGLAGAAGAVAMNSGAI